MKPLRSSTKSSTKGTVSPSGTSLYLHIPFCASKCRYCDFNSYPIQGQRTAPYLTALSLEIERRSPEQPQTIYIGGGTPSILEPKEIEALLVRLQKIADFRGHTEEVSFECNPESLTLEKAKILRELGVNRISIGVQSFDAEILRFYDRAHDANQARAAFAAARKAGFDNVNLDLIFGAPGQTLQHWRSDLEEALRLEPDHLSAYDLLYEEGTTLLKWKSSGRVIPNEEDAQEEMYRYTMGRLSQAGYERYEISNYARPGKRCLHNIQYWKNHEYVGVGAGAVSYLDGKRQKNISSVEGYTRTVTDGAAQFEEEEALSPRDSLGETMMMRLRLREGVDRREVLKQTGLDLVKIYSREIEEMKNEGLLLLDDFGLHLTERGLMLGDLVASRFL